MQPGEVVGIAVRFFGSAIVASAAWLSFRHGFGCFRPPAMGPTLPWLALALVSALAIIGMTRLIADWPWAKDFEREFHRTMGPLTRRETFLLAVLSGIGEEISFRGVLQ